MIGRAFLIWGAEIHRKLGREIKPLAGLAMSNADPTQIKGCSAPGTVPLGTRGPYRELQRKMSTSADPAKEATRAGPTQFSPNLAYLFFRWGCEHRWTCVFHFWLADPTRNVQCEWVGTAEDHQNVLGMLRWPEWLLQDTLTQR